MYRTLLNKHTFVAYKWFCGSESTLLNVLVFMRTFAEFDVCDCVANQRALRSIRRTIKTLLMATPNKLWTAMQLLKTNKNRWFSIQNKQNNVSNASHFKWTARYKMSFRKFLAKLWKFVQVFHFNWKMQKYSTQIWTIWVFKKMSVLACKMRHV